MCTFQGGMVKDLPSRICQSCSGTEVAHQEFPGDVQPQEDLSDANQHGEKHLLYSESCIKYATGSGLRRTQWKLESISSQGGQEYSLQYSTPQGSQTIKTRSVALTVPAYVAAELLKQVLCRLPAPRVQDPA